MTTDFATYHDTDLGMKKGKIGSRRFIDLPKSQRNEIIDMFNTVKNEFRKKCRLRDLGFKCSWDDVNVYLFLSHPKEHYIGIIEQNAVMKHSGGERLIREVEQLYFIVRSERPTYTRATLEQWLQAQKA